MIDIVTIGAGGGSIARVSDDRRADASGRRAPAPMPGPVCYGRGGTEPTVTDAHLVLGHLPPYLLGGSFALDVEAARDAMRRRIAEPLGMSVEAAARGILAIVDNNMVGAIRVVSVERGHDPRDFSLLPFGGAGPLHGGALARLLGMRTIVVPPAPGVLSALGLLVSNLKAEFTRTCLQKAGAFDVGTVARVFGELDARGARLARCRGRARRGAAHRLAGEPALPAPGLRAVRAVGGPRRDGRLQRQRPSQPSTACTSGSTPSRRRTRRSRS